MILHVYYNQSLGTNLNVIIHVITLFYELKSLFVSNSSFRIRALWCVAQELMLHLSPTGELHKSSFTGLEFDLLEAVKGYTLTALTLVLLGSPKVQYDV